MALLAILFLHVTLSAQPLQRLYAYDPGSGLEMGAFRDVAALPFVTSSNINVVTIGSSYSSTTDGLIGYHDPNGSPIMFREWRNPSGHRVQAEAITKTPSGDIVACFFDPVSFASDIVRTSPNGAFMWSRRLKGFHVRDVDSDWITTYPGGEGIWLTGESSNKKISIEGLTGAGAWVFSREYHVFHTIWNYGDTRGQGIQYDPVKNEVVVIGDADIAGLTLSDMILVRVNPLGAWSIGRAYTDPNGKEHYHGKALVPHPTTPGDFVVSFDYSNVTGLAYDQPAMMQMNPVGSPSWMYAYPGVGYFNGTKYYNLGIDTDGSTFLSSGFYSNFSTGNQTAYSLSTDLSGNPIQKNDYVLGGYFPATSSQFGRVEFNTKTGFYYIVGHFRSKVTSGGWPMGPSPRSFWMVATDAIGQSVCSKDKKPYIKKPEPKIPTMDHFSVTLPGPAFSPLYSVTVDPKQVKQCSAPKRFENFEAEAEGAAAIKFGYAADRSQIIIDIAGELTAQGTLELIDLQGKTLLKTSLKSGKQYLDASSISRGIYMLRYQVPGIQNGVKKISVH